MHSLIWLLSVILWNRNKMCSDLSIAHWTCKKMQDTGLIPSKLCVIMRDGIAHALRRKKMIYITADSWDIQIL